MLVLSIHESGIRDHFYDICSVCICKLHERSCLAITVSRYVKYYNTFTEVVLG